eukprot:7390486-Prymnesium_polylepis.1
MPRAPPDPLGPNSRPPAMPPKRAAAELAETTEEQVKKFRSALDSMADDWVCPICVPIASQAAL